MTREEIEALSPEELRVKVVEKLGWKKEKVIDHEFLDDDEYWYHNGILVLASHPHFSTIPPDYPNDIAACLRDVEPMLGDYRLNRMAGSYTLTPDETFCSVVGVRLATLFCRAFLMLED